MTQSRAYKIALLILLFVLGYVFGRLIGSSTDDSNNSQQQAVQTQEVTQQNNQQEDRDDGTTNPEPDFCSGTEDESGSKGIYCSNAYGFKFTTDLDDLAMNTNDQCGAHEVTVESAKSPDTLKLFASINTSDNEDTVIPVIFEYNYDLAQPVMLDPGANGEDAKTFAGFAAESIEAQVVSRDGVSDLYRFETDKGGDKTNYSNILFEKDGYVHTILATFEDDNCASQSSDITMNTIVNSLDFNNQ